MDSFAGLTVGVDLADRASAICVVGADGRVVSRETIPTCREAFRDRFSRGVYDRVVIEACTIASWVGWELEKLGQRVVVAHPLAVALIHKAQRKSDRSDSEKLARLARVDEDLVHPTHLRSRERAEALAEVRARASLVQARTRLVNTVRSIAKLFGKQLRRCTPAGLPAVVRELAETEPTLHATLTPSAAAIAALTAQIGAADRRLERRCKQFPETERMLKIHGVGALTALTFAMVIDDPQRFPKARDVGSYLGLVPKRSQTGETDPALRISKAGHHYLRGLLVQCAKKVLRDSAPASDLKRWGSQIASRGGKRAKHVAAVAVARRLAVTMLTLWKSESDYVPIREVAVTTAT